MVKPIRNPNSEELANKIIEEDQPGSIEDMQNALKDIFGPMFEAMLKSEMTAHLVYPSDDKKEKATENRRNGYGQKTIKSSTGNVAIQVSRDQDGSFEPQMIPKRQTDVSAIEDKVVSMYERGMSQRDISSTIEDIYGFSVSHDMLSDISNQIPSELEE